MRGVRREGSDSGAVLVEFAILLPVFLALVLALIDFAVAYRQQIMLRNAANAGGAWAAVQPCDVGGIRDRVFTEVQAENASVAAALPDASSQTNLDKYVQFQAQDGSTSGVDCTTAYQVKVMAPAPYTLITGTMLHDFASMFHVDVPVTVTITGTQIVRIQGR